MFNLKNPPLYKIGGHFGVVPVVPYPVRTEDHSDTLRRNLDLDDLRATDQGFAPIEIADRS